MQGIHGLLHASVNNVFDYAQCGADRLVRQRLFRCRGLLEHKAHDLGAGRRPSNAQTQPEKVRRAQFLNNICDAVVAARPAACFQPHRAGRQIEFVVHHQNLARRDFVVMRQLGYRFTTVIHEGFRRQQPQLASTDTELRHLARETAFAFERLTTTRQ